MEKINIKNWKLVIDPERTRNILKNIKSDAETCGCSYCRNFIAARDYVYPKDFLNILHKLGIDIKKDVHTSHLGKLEKGNQQYEIDYCFVGEIIEGPAEQEPMDILSFDFNFTISDKILYREKEFPKSVLVLQCFPVMPWVIDGKELE
jgi:hypothetical protein